MEEGKTPVRNCAVTEENDQDSSEEIRTDLIHKLSSVDDFKADDLDLLALEIILYDPDLAKQLVRAGVAGILSEIPGPGGLAGSPSVAELAPLGVPVLDPKIFGGGLAAADEDLGPMPENVRRMGEEMGKARRAAAYKPPTGVESVGQSGA